MFAFTLDAPARSYAARDLYYTIFDVYGGGTPPHRICTIYVSGWGLVGEHRWYLTDSVVYFWPIFRVKPQSGWVSVCLCGVCFFADVVECVQLNFNKTSDHDEPPLYETERERETERKNNNHHRHA